MMTKEQLEGKYILDACCSARSMWFQKDCEIALFADIRDENIVCSDGKTWNVSPDVVADFRDMPFPDESFKMVVFDPPHMRDLGDNSIMAQKYGKLTYHWRQDIEEGLVECLRVLEPFGFLIFKWSENEIPMKEILKLCPQLPLFGHTNGKRNHTIWMTFIKLPEKTNHE